MRRMGVLFALIALLLGLVVPSAARDSGPPRAAVASPAGLPSAAGVAQASGPPTASLSGPAGPAPTAGRPLALWPGPDGYGYRGESAPYAWVDIRTSGTRIAISGDDQCSAALPIGFAFPFYGASYTDFYAQTNGTLSFTPTTDFSNDGPLPDSRAPDRVIALAWDDLYMDRGAWARYQTFPICPVGPATACLVVTFANMDTLAGQSAGTWQALLYPSGEVRLQFQDAGQAAGASSTSGIEGADFLANHGLTYACEVAGSLAPSTTVRFSAPPLLLLPEEAAHEACRLEWQERRLDAVNRALAAATVTLSYTVAGPAEVSGPASLGPLAAGESRPFTVSVQLTEAAGLGTTAVVTITARAQESGVTATAVLAQRAAAAHLDDGWQSRPAGLDLYWGASYYDPGSDAVCFVDGLTGQSPNVVVANVHMCYDPATGSWTARAPAPVPVFAAAAGWIGDRFYLAGGFTSTLMTATQQVQVYDPAMDTWTARAAMPTARGGAASGVVNGRLYVAGGAGTGTYPLDCPTYAYDPALNSWTTRAACPLQGGYGLFLGGGVGSDAAGRLFAGGHFDAYYGWYAYDPVANTWSARAGLPGLVHRTPLFVERDGDVYMMGGLTGWTPGAEVYHYDPAADAWDALPPLLHRPTGGSLGPAHGSFGSPAYGGFWTYGGTAGSGALLPPLHEWWPWVLCSPCVDTTVEAWKTAPPSAALGQVISYTVVISVSGPLSGAWMDDPLPVGVAYAGGLTWTAGHAWHSAADDAVYWQGDGASARAIDSSSLITVTFDVTVTAVCPEEIANVGAAGCGQSSGLPFTATTTVVGPLPQASFTFAVAGCTAAFTNTSLYGEDYLWSFGDGATSTETHPLHTYDQDGTYTVTLALTNVCGTDGYTLTVEVDDCCEPVTWADFTWAPPIPTATLPVTLTATSDGTGVTYAWDFGDGTVASRQGAGGVGLQRVPEAGAAVTHTYATPGLYTVTLTATNACGQDTAAALVHVVAGPLRYSLFLPLVARESLSSGLDLDASRFTSHASSLASHVVPDTHSAAGHSLPAGPLSHADPVHVQEAANGAALKGTWVMVDYQGESPATDILRKVNATAQDYGVPDTNGVPDDVVNDNILAYYVYFDGSCVRLGFECWELHAGPNTIPAGARGLRVEVTLPITSAAVDLAAPTSAVVATATAVYVPDGGILPIAVNEYWLGSQGHCPYANCGEPYSFVRNPAEPPPFSSTDGGITWGRNNCPNPYNLDTCQGPYEGAGENIGRAFAILGADAKPNYGSQDPRSGVMLDSRYDALEDLGTWRLLIADDTWTLDAPVPDAQGKIEMESVLRAGGYGKVPIPRTVHEPPTDYIEDGWCYCWTLPYNEDHCFNFPCSGRAAPYDTVQFLSGISSSFLAQVMYDEGNYVQGRYAPGERILVAVYNSAAGVEWGSGAARSDAAVMVGYAGVMIVGYGNAFDSPCSGTPGDWQSYAHCVSGSVNTVYGIVGWPLTLDPTQMIHEWLPQRVELITPTLNLPVVAGGPAQSNLTPHPPHRPAPFDMAMDIPLTLPLVLR